MDADVGKAVTDNANVIDDKLGEKESVADSHDLLLAMMLKVRAVHKHGRQPKGKQRRHCRPQQALGRGGNQLAMPLTVPSAP